MNKRLFRLLSSVLAVSLLFDMAVTPAEALEPENRVWENVELPVSDSTWTKIEINSADDLFNLATACRYEDYSANLLVELKSDIDLYDVEFAPIPYFKGIFDGNGHTISIFSIANTTEPVGLFSIIGEGALVKDLTINGTIQPHDNCNYIGAVAGENRGYIYAVSLTGVVTGNNYVGGIVGLNEETGIIIDSSAAGAVRGDNMTGGIAGFNKGVIMDCSNEALINTESVETGKNLADIDISFNITKMSSQMVSSAADMGGIAGYSIGAIVGCDNSGAVGYNRQGYNIGGIAGRSAGYILDSNNTAYITGRKDVGGIAGQMEPYIQKTVTDSMFKTLEGQLNDMQYLMDKTRADAKRAGNAVSTHVDSITDKAEEAKPEPIDIKDEVNSAGQQIKNDIENKELPDIKFPEIDKSSIKDIDLKQAVSDAMDNKTSELDNYVNNINSQVEELNNELKGYSNLIDNDLKAVNGKLNEITTTLQSVKGMSVGIKDASLEDIDLITLGAIKNCKNGGSIEGDLNAGGIVGVMGEESSVDPEDEISLSLDYETHTEYEYKAVLDSCVNTGIVTVKRNYAGGIVARAEIGYIKNAENYGAISASGNYVGGIAASSSITIDNCYAKETLSGVKHIGGIVGEGTSQSANQAGSLVSNCRALTNIKEATKFYGAIAGSPDGEYIGNIFTSDSLAGLGTYSNDDAANVSYKELTEGEGVPEEFTKLHVRFYADNILLDEAEVKYDQSYSNDLYPKIPAKKGYYAKWDVAELNNIHSDINVNAVYTTYISSLASEAKRNNGRPVFYVEGDFSEGLSLAVTKDSKPEYNVGAYSNNPFEKLFYTTELEEEWTITIPRDGRNLHTLRFMPTDVSAHEPVIYISTEDGFEKADTNKLGSYISIDVYGDNVVLAIVSSQPNYLAIVISIAVLIAILTLIVIIVRLSLRLKKNDSVKVDIKEQETDESETEVVAKKERKPRKGLVIAFRIFYSVIMVAVVVLSIYLAKNPEFVRAKIAHILTEEIVNDGKAQFEIDAKISEDDTEKKLSSLVWFSDDDSHQIECIETNGMAIYRFEDKLYLESGAAFEASSLVPDYSKLFKLLSEAYKEGSVSTKKVDGGTEHYLKIKGDVANDILDTVLGEYSSDIETVESASVTLNSSNWKIGSVRIKCSLLTESGDRISSDININVIDKKELYERSVPASVYESINTNRETVPITVKMLDLIAATGELINRDPAVCDITVRAEGNVLSLNDRLYWYRTRVNNEWINCVTKNGVSLYYNDRGACTSKGVSLSNEQSAVVDKAKLIDMVYDMCLSRRYIIETKQGKTIYQFDLTDTDIASIAVMIAPELSGAEKKLESGRIAVTISDNKEIEEIDISVCGKAKVLTIDKAFTLSTSIRLAAASLVNDYQIPSEAVDLLAGR